jgi:protein-S-isoprenylcysteine O-methyltransferase Ste14
MGMRMLKELDIPPLWLALALAASWGLSQIWSLAGLAWIGLGLIGLGLGIMALAVGQMLLGRTTFVPRRDPQALVTGGVFGLSRNPIYLADAVVLTGAILFWGAVLALPLIPAFVALITQRYIHDEETRLRAGFGAQADAYFAKVPRWIGRALDGY